MVHGVTHNNIQSFWGYRKKQAHLINKKKNRLTKNKNKIRKKQAYEFIKKQAHLSNTIIDRSV